jgi:hypothetical protein
MRGLPVLLAPALLLALLPGACASSSAAGPPGASGAASASAPGSSPAVARVDGQTLSKAELDAHQARTGLARQQALDDLVDLALLRAAATQNGVVFTPETVAVESRTTTEYEVARKLALEVPAASELLVVDHAWMKDAPRPKQQAAQRKTLEHLRALVADGATIPEAYKKLGPDAANWHIGDHEEYPYDVVPAEAHDLPVDALSPIVPGNGGLHLFKIHQHKRVLPPAEAVHALVRERLRQGKTIELVGQ